MPLTLEQTQTLISAAHGHAREAGLEVTVAVVDEGGLLQALGRMDGAPRSVRRSLRRRRWAPPSGTVAADGSVVVRDGDAVLGAVGVSGAKPEEDRGCAEAGVAAALG